MSIKEQKQIIFSAAKTGDIDCIEDLIRQECSNVMNDYKDGDGNNVLLVGAQGGHDGLVLRLLELGAVIDMKNNNGQTALQIACEQGYEKVAQVLLEKNADIYSVDHQGNTVLHSAVQRGCDKLIETLLDRGASKFINLINNHGDTALQSAFRLGNEKAAHILLERGAHIDLVKRIGNTALHMACGWGNEKIVNILLKSGSKNTINSTNAKGETALHIACERGHVNVVRTLLEKGADIRRLDQSGNTALDTAYQWSRDKMVEVLLNGEKNTTERNNDGTTNLQVAFEQNHNEAMRGLIDNYALTDCVDKRGNTILHNACWRGSFQVVKMLLDRDSKQLINKPNFLKETPLHVACEKGWFEIVEALVEGGADLCCGDKEGNTVLHKACMMEKEELASILIKRGKTEFINILNKANKTALHYACKNGLYRVVWCLLEGGADMYLVDANGNTILHQLFIDIYSYLRLETVEIMLDRVPRQYITKRNVFGKTALHLACENNCVRIVPLMLERNVDVDLCDGSGNTLLHSACKGGGYELVDMLLSRGAGVNKLNNDGVSALRIAVGHNYYRRIVKILIENGASYEDKNGNTILHIASSLGTCEIVNVLLDLNPTLINKKNFEEKTALHVACQKGIINVAKVLIERGADMNCVDEEGYIILHLACLWENNTVVEMLLDQGGSKYINKPNKNGETAFHIAYKQRSVETMKILLEKGADIGCVDCSSGDTILHKACRKREGQIVKLLLYYGAKVNQEGRKYINKPNKTGETALHIAYEQRSVQTMTMLLEKGADIDCVDCSSGDTILHKACRDGDDEIVKLLLYCGANVDLLNYEGEKACIDMFLTKSADVN